MDYVQLGGESRPISFGMGALMMFEKKSYGRKALEAFKDAENFSMTDAVTLVACGLENGARRDGKPQAFDPFEVGDWLDEAPDALATIFELFAASFASPDAKKKTMTKAK